MTFFEILCGQMPFGSRAELPDEQVAARMVSLDYPHPDQLAPYLPLRFRRVFQAAFKLDPAEREYQTAAAMRGALKHLAVHVEWRRHRKAGYAMCFEGYEVGEAGNRTGTTLEASIVERPPRGRFDAQIRRAPPGGELRRLHGLPTFRGSKAQVAQKLSVWMRTLMERGDIPRA